MTIKKLLKRILLVIVTLVILGLFYYELTQASVRRIEIDVQTRVFDNLPSAFDNKTLVFFSDVHFNKFMDAERLMPFIETINDLNPDIILFGGDLFDHPSVDYPSETTIETMTSMFKNLQAPLGKFAVYGNHDLESSLTKSLIANIYQESGFQLLVNESVKIYHEQFDSITLVGLDSQLLGQPDIKQAFQDVDEQQLVITLSHTPDIVSELTNTPTQWQLSGHSHGGQIALPLIGPIYKVPFATQYPKSQTVETIILDVSNGIGTTRFDMRLFANPQIHHYTLRQTNND